jgi:hypothetical protein
MTRARLSPTPWAILVAAAVLVAGCSSSKIENKPPVAGPTLTAITVAPDPASVAKGLTVTFTATGHYSDASIQDVTASAAWSSSSGNATVSAGVATGVNVGAAAITATLEGVSGSASLTVTAAALQAITVTPNPASVAKGLTVPFTATGRYSDSSTQNLTASVTWSSSSANASISAAGVATGVTAGPATITATSGAISGNAALTVDPAALQSIAVTPDPAFVAKGLTVAFTATGSYSDGSTRNLTASVTWSSSSANASVSVGGVATGLVAGPATITATSGTVSDAASLTVTAPVLQSIEVTPDPATVAKGLTVGFTATGHYSDASTQDLTSTVTWSSSTANASITAGGSATGLLVGPAIIRATAGLLSGSAALTVTAPLLQSITVTPDPASVAKGLDASFTATGHYSDTSTQDLTASASWTSSSANATITAPGTAHGAAVGPATITATSGLVSGSAALTVGPAVLQSITLAPDPASVP